MKGEKTYPRKQIIITKSLVNNQYYSYLATKLSRHVLRYFATINIVANRGFRTTSFSRLSWTRLTTLPTVGRLYAYCFFAILTEAAARSLISAHHMGYLFNMTYDRALDLLKYSLRDSDQKDKTLLNYYYYCLLPIKTPIIRIKY